MHFNGKQPNELMWSYAPGTHCIVLGDATCKYEEYAQAREEWPRATLMVLNDSGRGFDGLQPDFVATMHGAVGNFIGTHRMPLERIPQKAIVFGYKCNGDEHERVDFVVDAEPIWGTCALLGVLCALWLGVDQIILAGCPLSGAYGAGTKLEPWKQWAPYFKGRVHALSGALVEILEATV